MKLILTRTKKTDDGVLGVITRDGKELCKTYELPWRDNAPRISCIPEGAYECQPYDSLKFPNVWEVTNVPGRSAILIHAGNKMDDTLGCILVGQNYGVFEGKPGVVNSRITLNMLRQMLPQTFTLTVK